ncbi:Ig-like domain-containing protein [Flavobacterium stagni]|uniref:T9SS type A sorting domain-containing protein n=1 Tax=Flavobacterium stagni TaxID=2506421 RepID=A0A4Q1K6Z2_9FLAO|nr:LamG-like jellyroll fold domain-containing protein [Flavobacterium stagni]RXR21637.1 T9SS type A sorting domain-containing protein [Flavobacterium stagni]
MKKVVLGLLFVFFNLLQAQTPVYQFDFDGNANNSGTGTFTGWNLSGAGSLTYVNNRFGQANKAINIPNNVTFVNQAPENAPNLPAGNSARTLSFWVKFINDNDVSSYCVVGWGANIANNAYGFWRNGVQNSYYTWGAGNDYNVPQTNSQIQAQNNGWVHIAMTHTGSTFTIYYNGVDVGNYARTLNTFGPSYLVLNRLVNAATNGTGIAFQLDDLRIYNTALTPAQVSALYTATQLPSLPTISNVSVTALGPNSATISYDINANNAATTTEIRYNVPPSGALQIQAGPSASGNSVTTLSQTLSGLQPNTTYSYAVWASNSQGTSITPTALSFTTLAPATQAPAITNVTAAPITFNAATINFNLNAFGTPTTYVVEYETFLGGPITTVNGGTTSVNVATPFQVQLTGLTPNSNQYSYRVKATNSSGQVTYSNWTPLTTPSPLVLTNVSDSTITSNSAQINYTLNTNGYSTIVEIDYQAGTIFDTDLPYTTVSVNSALTNTAATNYTYTLSGLNPNTTYSYRLGAAIPNVASESYQENAAFTTLGVSAAPTAPSPQSFCNGATVANLNATGTTIKWYTSATGGSPLAATTVLTTGVYYVSQTQPNLTESTRISVQVNITIISPPSNVPSNQTFCTGATLGSIQTGAGSNFQWYAAATGGAVLPNSTVISSGTYYLSQTISGCESSRTPVSVTVSSPNAPTAQAQTFCNGATVANLVASGTNIKWYLTATGGSPLSNVTTLATGTYYVSQTVNACESGRQSVNVTVNTTVPPTVPNNQTFCSGATINNIQVTSGTNMFWYTAATGGTALSFSAPLSTGTYYVSQTVNGCVSTRTAVAVSVNQVGAPTGNANQTFVQGNTVANLVATGTAIVWFSSEADALANSNPLASNTLLVNQTTYYAVQTVNGCRSTAALAVFVTVTLSTSSVTQPLQFTLAPNPATTAIVLQSADEITKVSLYSLQGQLLQTTKSNILSVIELPAGVYFVEVENANAQKGIQKFIKQN